ncbi:MAG: DNA polymerase III subunit gamma/tau [Dehalococcoidia bacterium]|nr:DNA polymerase III subunit gamma/tau [Dehalococcoidia bacterium]
MVGEVLYRRWRPRRFGDVSGQEIVVTTLRQAVAQGRVAHAYLFCGPRGTGKTSTARILAKAVNCLAPQGGEPDGTCAMCVAIDEGRALDLVEIDAASNRGVEDARSLRERVFGSGPAEARSKVYIVDEVHMLTDPAFNTLLKTLEEPAPWAIFILCTTEADKVLATVVSRCQRFDFRRITTADTVARLETICKAEGYTAEPEALVAVARASSGSLRDALNLVEQLASAYGRAVTTAGVQEMLGLRGSEHALPLVRHVLKRDVAQALALLNTAGNAGVDMRVLHREALAHLRAVLLIRSGVGDSVELPKDAVEELRALAPQTTMELVLRAIRAFAQANVKSAEGIPSLPLELAVVEVCADQAPATPTEAPRQAAPSRPPAPAASRPPGTATAPYPPRGAPTARPPVAGAQGWPAPARPPVSSPAASATGMRPAASAQPAAPSPRSAPPSPQWEALLKALRLTKGKSINVGSMVNSCSEHRVEGNELVLVFQSASNMERLQAELEQPEMCAVVQKAVCEAFGGDYELKLVANGNGAAQGKPSGYLVRAAIGMGSRIIEEAKEGLP